MGVEKIDKRAVMPLYLQIAALLRQRIAGGDITGMLPSERDLAKQYRVAIGTCRHALKVLRDEGIVVTYRGRGTGVAPPD